MAKTKRENRTRACRRCGYNFREEKSQCPSCCHWNHGSGNIRELLPGEEADQTVLLSNVSANKMSRIKTGPWDKCLGGGMVHGNVVLIGGAPGAGKSTLGLQLSNAIAAVTNRETLYIAAEESNDGIRARADRLRIRHKDKIRLVPMGCTADLGDIMRTRAPSGIVLDSLSGIARDIKEEVEMAEALKDYAVLLNCPVMIVDHVNKKEEFAGLMELQHVVDVTISLSSIYDDIREMETVKSRQGAAQITVKLRMTEFEGLIAAPEEEDEDEDD